MFTSSSAGFYKSPISKALLILIGSASSTLFFLNPIQHKYLQSTTVWRIFGNNVLVLELHILFLVLLVLYNFRIFERRMGSRRFASYLLANGALSYLLEVGLYHLCELYEYELPVPHNRIIAVLSSLFVPFFLDVPNMSQAAVQGSLIQLLTGKALTYLLGAQVAASSSNSTVLFVIGILSGLLYRVNICYIKSWFQIPKIVGKIFSSVLGPVFNSRPPTEDPFPLGATVEIQRQIRLEVLEQRMLFAQTMGRRRIQGRPGRQQTLFQLPNFNVFRQNPQQRPLPPTPLLQPSFHPRVEINGNSVAAGMPVNNINRPSTSRGIAPSLSSPSPVSEERVQQLVAMGFNRTEVQSALMASENDINVATNILLQD